MEYLRWILIIAGVLILIGIVVFANPKRKAKPARPRKPGKHAASRKRVEPILDTETDAVSEQDAVDAMQQQSITGLETADTNKPAEDASSVEKEQPGVTHADYIDAGQTTVQPPAEVQAKQPQAPVPGNDQIVNLYVVGRQRHPISGMELLDAALKAGLNFGAQDIFHRLPQGSEKPIFSMANLTAPGYFDRTAWNLFETQGVTLFMTLPGPTSALVAWDSMLATAERLAELLKAEVQDKQRQPLTRQSIAHQREAMRAFDRQKN